MSKKFNDYDKMLRSVFMTFQFFFQSNNMTHIPVDKYLKTIVYS